MEVGGFSAAHATAKSVTDSAGDAFTELLHFTGSDGAEESVWTAPISHGATRPSITVTPTAAADTGLAALEYSGLLRRLGARFETGRRDRFHLAGRYYERKRHRAAGSRCARRTGRHSERGSGDGRQDGLVDGDARAQITLTPNRPLDHHLQPPGFRGP